MGEENIRQRSQVAIESLGERIKRAFDVLMGRQGGEADGRKRDFGEDLKRRAAHAVERAEDTMHEGAGAAKRTAGRVIGNESRQGNGWGSEREGGPGGEANR